MLDKVTQTSDFVNSEVESSLGPKKCVVLNPGVSSYPSVFSYS
jgi:hypothetical protein